MIKNRDFLIASIKRNKEDLITHASIELKNDKEIALLILSKNGYYLRYFSEEIRENKELVLLATKSSKYALEFASAELKKEKNFLYNLNEYLIENKMSYKEEFELLQKYQREEMLLEKIQKISIGNDKISLNKKKI